MKVTLRAYDMAEGPGLYCDRRAFLLPVQEQEARAWAEERRRRGYAVDAGSGRRLPWAAAEQEEELLREEQRRRQNNPQVKENPLLMGLAQRFGIIDPFLALNEHKEKEEEEDEEEDDEEEDEECEEVDPAEFDPHKIEEENPAILGICDRCQIGDSCDTHYHRRWTETASDPVARVKLMLKKQDDDLQPESVEARLGGTQELYHFANGWGASVVRHDGSYGHEQGHFELAVFHKNEEDDWSISYDSSLSTDVLGNLNRTAVKETLKRIKALPTTSLPH